MSARYSVSLLDNLSIAEWSNYLAVQAEVAATLTGLVFVAVSINLSRVLSVPGVSGRAAESLMQLFSVVIVSSNMLVPGEPDGIRAAWLLVAGAALWLAQTTIQIRYARSKTGHPKFWLFTRVAQTQVTSVPFCVAGVLLFYGSPAGMQWLSRGFTFSLVSGVLSAWVLLVEILR